MISASQSFGFVAADLTALGNVPVAGLVTGEAAYVTAMGDFYVLDKVGSHTADAVTVIAGSGGAIGLLEPTVDGTMFKEMFRKEISQLL